MAERADSEESEIIEGFLCPICKADLKSFSRLKNHFQETHPEDQDVLKSLKDLFGKATKKILKLDDNLSDSVKIVDYEYDIKTEVQEIGYIRSHTKQFKAIRCDHLEHFATETNKLIIRLDQLLLVDNSDRRQHEQNVVQWIDGSSVKLCPQCAKSFNLTRRQHHCRLCGTIMCHSCTLFLSIYAAKSLISGINEDRKPKTVDESNSLRICSHCMEMLDYRRRIQMSRTSKPIICELYNKLWTMRNNIGPNVEMYKKMCTSLHAGEHTYKLGDAQALRGNIGKQGEILDAISKQISGIPLNPDIPRAISLQNAIKRSTSNYIKDTLLSLPPLPTLEELHLKRNHTKNNRNQTSSRPTTRNLEGWSPDIRKNVKEDIEDPLLQQIEIVKGFIAQARSATKLDDVTSLERNLKELLEVYNQQKQGISQNNT